MLATALLIFGLVALVLSIVGLIISFTSDKKPKAIENNYGEPEMVRFLAAQGVSREDIEMTMEQRKMLK